jgi:hypothetical protein
MIINGKPIKKNQRRRDERGASGEFVGATELAKFVGPVGGTEVGLKIWFMVNLFYIL